MKIAIVNYGAGNIQSIKFAVQRLGYEAVLSNNENEIRSADKVIFPGVGEASSAMKMLKSRLYELELRKREAEQEKINATKSDNSWGHQIRSYVMHPYQMVKDLRTGYEVGNYQNVLDGELDGFINAALLSAVNFEKNDDE